MASTSHFIDGQWIAGTGEAFESLNPATGQPIWQGNAATPAEIDAALRAARQAADEWVACPLQQRIFFLQHFAELLQERRAELAEAISLDSGKPRWEATGEVDSMIGKVSVSIAAFNERRRTIENEAAGGIAATRFKPYGVFAVFGPFNFPGHLPNGHIVPALLAGNTVVFKPSELTPLVGQLTVQIWEAAGIPRGVINLVQGGRETGAALAAHPQLDGLLFTGSDRVGKSLCHVFADHPNKMLALEMGGNNPLVVHEVADLDAAAYLAIQSSFLTAGQRCTCARRLIVIDGIEGNAIVDRICSMAASIKAGAFTDDPEPFMGPLISRQAADRVLEAQQKLMSAGGKPLLQCQRLNSPGGAMLSAGLIDVTAIVQHEDAEVFGPLLQVIRVTDFPAAITEANRTRFGLAAGLLSDSREKYELFFRKIRAGVVNWNRQTTGASGSLPFGGVGLSGNHHPSGYYAADYCSYPVASLENPTLTLPTQRVPGIVV